MTLRLALLLASVGTSVLAAPVRETPRDPWEPLKLQRTSGRAGGVAYEVTKDRTLRFVLPETLMDRQITPPDGRLPLAPTFDGDFLVEVTVRFPGAADWPDGEAVRKPRNPRSNVAAGFVIADPTRPQPRRFDLLAARAEYLPTGKWETVCSHTARVDTPDRVSSVGREVGIADGRTDGGRLWAARKGGVLSAGVVDPGTGRDAVAFTDGDRKDDRHAGPVVVELFATKFFAREVAVEFADLTVTAAPAK
jgi:hypothetical protein